MLKVYNSVKSVENTRSYAVAEEQHVTLVGRNLVDGAQICKTFHLKRRDL